MHVGCVTNYDGRIAWSILIDICCVKRYQWFINCWNKLLNITWVVSNEPIRNGSCSCWMWFWDILTSISSLWCPRIRCFRSWASVGLNLQLFTASIHLTTLIQYPNFWKLLITFNGCEVVNQDPVFFSTKVICLWLSRTIHCDIYFFLFQ